MEIYGNIWKYMEIYGNIWKYMEIYGNRWKYIEMVWYGMVLGLLAPKPKGDTSLAQNLI